MPRKTRPKESQSYSPSRSSGAGGSRRRARAAKQALHQIELAPTALSGDLAREEVK